MKAISSRVPDVEFHGVGGETMVAQGLRSLVDMDQFAVNGFVDPLLRIGSLFGILQRLVRELSLMDVVVGVDFNFFNLLMERRLRKLGVPTAHYVSPSVYAWRRGRVKRIGSAVDVIMTLFPFETAVYNEHGIRAVFVGHPTADKLDPDASKDTLRNQARVDQGLPLDQFILTLMPGSRGSEIEFHFELFLAAAQLFQQTINQGAIKVIVPTGHPSARKKWLILSKEFPSLDVEITDTHATQALAACDLALVKSGTSTLEAMLTKTPMVVAYRLGALTFRLVRSMMYIDHVALPNILANNVLVPEFLQDDASPRALAEALVQQVSRDKTELHQKFAALHRTLKRNAAERAAETVLALVKTP